MGEDGERGLSLEQYRKFCATWAVYDAKMTWVIPENKLFVMLCDLKPPLGFGFNHQPPPSTMRDLLAPLQLAEYEADGEVYFEFEDVARAVAKKMVLEKMGVQHTELESFAASKKQKKIEKRAQLRKVVSRTGTSFIRALGSGRMTKQVGQMTLQRKGFVQAATCVDLSEDADDDGTDPESQRDMHIAAQHLRLAKQL